MLRFKYCRNIGRLTRTWRMVALVAAVGVLSACTPVVISHGQTPDPDDLELVEVGQSTRRDVEKRLGTPSTSSVSPMVSGVVSKRSAMFRPPRCNAIG